MNTKKDKLSKLELALKKNLKKRKIFQKKLNKNNKLCQFSLINGSLRWQKRIR